MNTEYVIVKFLLKDAFVCGWVVINDWECIKVYIDYANINHKFNKIVIDEML